MPKVIVTTDDGQEVWSHDYPVRLEYALTYMPSCPTNTGVNDLLNGLKRGLQDASSIQRLGHIPERASERAVREAMRARDAKVAQ